MLDMRHHSRPLADHGVSGFNRAYRLAVIIAAVSLSIVDQAAIAAINWTGAIDPDDPRTWTSDTDSYIGMTADAALTVNRASDLYSNYSFIGYDHGSMGAVTIDGVGSTWSNARDLDVGSSGSGTLAITNGGSVKSLRSYVGRHGGAAGAVTVDGASSTWTNQDVYIGASGNGTLAITGGGTADNSDARIGYNSGSTGTVIVDGTGSTWTSGDLRVGTAGAASLAISGGATVTNGSGYIAGVRGTVTVDGIGSTWTTTKELHIGSSDSALIAITGGGSAITGVGYGRYLYSTYIGSYSDSTGAVTVEGVGSSWTNALHLYVGHLGSGTLAISDGGAVAVAGDTFVAHQTDRSGEIQLNNGTLSTGGLIAAVADLTGTGTINTHGLLADIDLVFDATHGLKQRITFDKLTGQNVTLNLDVDGSATLGAGYIDAGTMSISDGVLVQSTFGTIGFKSGSEGTVAVDGIDSTWAIRSSLTVGSTGDGTLAIAGGGAVKTALKSSVDTSASVIGFGTNSIGAVTIDGAGSNWTNGSSLHVGRYGSGTLAITNGGIVSDMSGHIGYGSGSNGYVTIDGVGSTWINDGSLSVGLEGNGTLAIMGGGTVSSSDSSIGTDFDSTGVLTVDGVGSTWTNSRSVTIGRFGSGTLAITNGGTAEISRSSNIGIWNRSEGIIIVDGVGSRLDHGDHLVIGEDGNGTVSITGGGAMSNLVGYIGRFRRSVGEVTVDGAGSTWTNRGDLHVGHLGTGVLTITHGGLLSVGGTLSIEENDAASFINMSRGGMLALMGDADESLTQFLDLVDGTDAIHFWDESLSAWALLTSAAYGEDYTLEYLTSGNLAGYTLLTVGAVPEPAAWVLAGLGAIVVLHPRVSPCQNSR